MYCHFTMIKLPLEIINRLPDIHILALSKLKALTDHYFSVVQKVLFFFNSFPDDTILD